MDCPLATWGFPKFDIDVAKQQAVQSQGFDPAHPWNASLLEGEPISGGASDNISYFQGPLAPDVLACQIYGYTTFSNSSCLGCVLTTDITLEPDIQYAFTYAVNETVQSVQMQTSYGLVDIFDDVGKPLPDQKAMVIGYVWFQEIGSKGRLGGIEFMLKQQLTAKFVIFADGPTGDTLAGSLAVFKQGP